MRKLILTALMAATAFPVAAEAQSRGEIRRDRRDIQEQKREYRDAVRRGDWRDARDARGDLRDARRELREDRNDRNRRWGDNDWRDWRNRNRGVYARGNWRAPFRYYAFRPGVRIAPVYYTSSYWIADPWRYRLPPAGYGERWVRHYDDLLLVDTRRGIVLRVIHNFYW
ncbi:MAG: RcnB family protein [Proteobacteria bacterium]|nr:RcnB family protein [Pseudomonadota bacterium]